MWPQSIRELKNDLQCSLFQVGTCGSEGCNIRNFEADDVEIGLEVYRQHIAVTTSGMELAGGGSRRLPRNVRHEEMGNWIWICEGLLIVFLTEMLGGINASLVTECCRQRKEAESEKRRVVATQPSGGARDPSVVRDTLG